MHPVQPPPKQFAAFAELYGEVSQRFEVYARRYPAIEQDWLINLVASFDRLYRAWPTDPGVQFYLERLRNRKMRLQQLLGHASLHICWDLTRVLADSIEIAQLRTATSQPSTPLFSRFLGAPYIVPPLRRARIVYRDANPLFSDVLSACADRYSVLGIFSILGWISRSLAKKLTFWVIALRLAAWIRAEELATATNRTAEEAALWRAIESNAFIVFDIRNPAFWLDHLGLPFFAFLPLSAAYLSMTLTTCLLVLTSFLAASAFFLTWWAHRVIDVWGARTLDTILGRVRAKSVSNWGNKADERYQLGREGATGESREPHDFSGDLRVAYRQAFGREADERLIKRFNTGGTISAENYVPLDLTPVLKILALVWFVTQRLIDGLIDMLNLFLRK